MMTSFNFQELKPVVSSSSLQEFSQVVTLKSGYLYFKNPGLPISVCPSQHPYLRREVYKYFQQRYHGVETIDSNVIQQILTAFADKQLTQLIQEYKHSNIIQRKTVFIKINLWLAEIIVAPLPEQLRFKDIAKMIIALTDDFKNINTKLFYICGKTDSDDTQLIYNLFQQGAKLSPHYINTPKYSSWADIDHGVKLILEKNDVTIEYIPNKIKYELNSSQTDHFIPELFVHNPDKSASLGRYVNVYTKNIVTCFLSDHQDKVKSVIDKHILPQKATLYLSEDQLFNISIKEMLNNKVSTKKTLKQLRVQDIFSEFFIQGQDDKSLLRLQELITVLKDNTHMNNFFYAYSFNTRTQEQNSLGSYSDAKYVEVFKGITISKAKKFKGAQWNKEDKKIASMNKAVLPKNLEEIIYQTCLTNKLTVSSKHNYQQQATFHHLFTHISQKYDIKQLDEQQLKLLNILVQEVAFTWLMYAVKHNQKSKSYVLNNSCPLSEKGQLQVSFSGDYQPALQLLAELGIVSSFEKPVKPKGYVHPICAQSEKLKLPKNHVILHGLTGISSTSGAYQRLKSIVGQGGLLSQAERRRYDIKVHSMSPIGDMASGLDWAVPATITNLPSYGNHIFFVVKPEILQRKHLFFSPTDFGGGKDRSRQYDDYAKSIGQNTFISPLEASHKKQHLKKGVVKNRLNEIWIDHSITWEDISHVLVINSIYDKVKSLLQSNSSTKHVQVVSFEAHNYAIDIDKTIYPSNISKVISKVARQQKKNNNIIQENIIKFQQPRKSKLRKDNHPQSFGYENYLENSYLSEEKSVQEYVDTMKKLIQKQNNKY